MWNGKTKKFVLKPFNRIKWLLILLKENFKRKSCPQLKHLEKFYDHHNNIKLLALDLCAETKVSRFESGYYLCAEVSSLQ